MSRSDVRDSTVCYYVPTAGMLAPVLSLICGTDVMALASSFVQPGIVEERTSLLYDSVQKQGWFTG